MKFSAADAFWFSAKWGARYATFPLNVILAGDHFDDLKPKATSNSKFAFLASNPLTRFFQAFVIIMGVNQGVQQLTALSFDDVQNYLDNEGFSEQVINDFEDVSIRLRERDRWGSIHTFHDYPPFLSLMSNLMHKRMENDALPTYGGGIGTLLNTNKWLKMVKPYVRGYLNSMATLPREGATAEEMISQLGEIPAEMLDGLDISDLKLKQALLLYVFRMLDPSVEYKSFGSKSVEAYLYAFETVGEMHGDPGFINLALKIASIDFEHDGVGDLYEAMMLDAYFQGTEMPSQHDARKAQREISDLFPSDYDPFTDDIVSKYRIMTGILDNHSDGLSDLAKRRIELFINAAEFFAPDLRRSKALEISITPS